MVHLYGMPAKTDEILSIGNKFNIPVIENAADAFGSKYKGLPVGVYGDFGIISFNGNKIITTSGGGALISKKTSLIDKAKYLSNQARKFTPEYYHEDIGYNYMMSNIVAGIGRAQLEVIEERVEQRRYNFNVYYDNLSKYDFFDFSHEGVDSYSNRWLTVLVVNPDNNIGIDRNKIFKALENNNIESRPAWKPMHLQPIFKHYPYYGNPISEYISENGLCLPSGSSLNDQDLDRIIRIIKKTVE